MAVGGSHKGNGSNGGNRGKPYGLMLLLAFGVALLGVMVIHKLRERRIFNLLVKEKDNDIISLQLLLQKEREHTNDMKRKNEEMKAKLYSIRNQKMELERRLLEMQSTVDSLKDEQRTLESALEEKQSENRIQRETNKDAQHENSQMVALMKSLKQKEAEIEKLKRGGVDKPSKIWSVSLDDPSSSNSNSSVDREHMDKIQLSENKEGDEQNNLANPARRNGSDDTSISLVQHEGLVKVEHRNEGGEGITDDGEKNKSKGFQYQVSFGGAEGNSTANGTVATIHEEGKMGEVGDAEVEEDQQGIIKGGAKLEMADNFKHETFKGKGKRVNLRSGKGRRWRVTTRNKPLGKTKNPEDSGLESTRRAPMGREDGKLKVRKTEKYGVSGEDKPLEATKAMDIPRSKLPEPKGIEESDNPDTVHAILKSRSGFMNQRQGEANEKEGQEINGSQESNNRQDANKQENRVVQAKMASIQENPEAAADETNAEIDAAAGYLFKDSASDSEEYKDEIEESEF